MESVCPYCNKLVPSNSAFCVNCGRDLRLYKEPIKVASKPRLTERPTEPITGLRSKIHTLFNILVFVLAIICIVAFTVYYVKDKMSSPADKDKAYEEIIENLYRNTKYQFRIKFPESWEIKKGDGPNILVKATSGEGSSINIYVKDVGIELGDINDLISIDEWANSISEKFPSANIISKKEIYIDNKKAYFVQYSANYKALDHEADMIFYNVGLVNKNFAYIITAGSAESKFESEKQTLDQSVRTFVVEEYGTSITSEDQNSNFQSDNAPINKERKENKSELTNQPWFRNSLLGISFQTPEKLEEQPSKPPAGYEEYITKFKTYFSKEHDLIVIFMYAESKFDTYDKETGLNGAISNTVNSMNGSDLKLKFSEPKTNYDDLRCSGSYKLQGREVQVKGYVYWNGNGKFFLLTTMGDKKDLKSMDKVIESLRINIP